MFGIVMLNLKYPLAFVAVLGFALASDDSAEFAILVALGADSAALRGNVDMA